MVDLRADGARVAQLWNGSQASRVPLSIVRNDVLPALLKIERSGIEYLAPRRMGRQTP
jgi:hypothetical protein